MTLRVNYLIQCDECKRRDIPWWTIEEAQAFADMAKWKTLNNKHICPNCQSKTN